MRVLISGSRGFLGQIVKDSLAKDGHQVFSLGKHSSNDYCSDLSREVPFIRSPVDLIIHAAGKAHSIPKTLAEEQEFFDVNYQGTVNLCNAIDKLDYKPKSFVFISTVAVYGLDQGIGIAENSPLLGVTPYAKSKILAESYLIDWARRSGVVLGILRLPLLVGPNPPGNLGSMIKGIKSGYYFNIAGGKAKKSMVLAADVAKIISTVADIGGIYNLCDGYNPSFAELSTNIAAQLNKSRPLNIPFWLAKLMGRLGDLIGPKAPINSLKLKKIMADLIFDDAKAKAQLGWKPVQVLNGFKID